MEKCAPTHKKEKTDFAPPYLLKKKKGEMRPYRQQRKQDKKCASLLEQNEKITPLPSKRKKTNFAGFFVVKEQYGKSVPSHKEENNDLAPPPPIC